MYLYCIVAIEPIRTFFQNIAINHRITSRLLYDINIDHEGIANTGRNVVFGMKVGIVKNISFTKTPTVNIGQLTIRSK